MSKNSIVPMELASINGLSITNAWKPINVNGFEYPCIRLKIINLTYAAMLISYDGYYSHEFVDSRDELEIDFQKNASPSNDVSMLPSGTIVYVKYDVDIPKGHSVKLITYGVK